MMLYRRYAIAILTALLAIALPCAAQAQRLPAEWTILIYLDADNNLERNAIDDFVEMASVASNPAVNVVVQFDRIDGYDSRYGDWTEALRFHVTQGMTPEPQHALANLGEANMGDPQTLTDFVTWGRAAYPAQRTAVVIWNHGDGWRTADALKEQRKAIAWDDTNGGDALDLIELRGALSTITAGGAQPLDLLAFDACLMAMIEIDDQMRPYVRVRTASEETEPGTGYPFDTILADLYAHPAWDAAALGESIVTRYYEEYSGETHSAVDLGAGYASLVDAVDQLAAVLIANQDDLVDTLRSVRRDVQQFQVHYVDLDDFAARLAEATEIVAVDQAAQSVVDAVEEVVIAERHGSRWSGAHGITIFFPAQPSGWDSAYDGETEYLTFTAGTQWDDFLVAYLHISGVCDPDPYEPDNDPDAASPIAVDGTPQSHGFCPENDAADWVSFVAQAGHAYDLETFELEAYSDTVLRLYDVDGQSLLAENDDGGAGWASLIEWTSPTTGRYYLQVTEYFGRTGDDSGYALSVSSPSLSMSITGTARLQGRSAHDGIAIQTTSHALTTTTNLTGTFTLQATAPCTVTASHPGYLPAVWTIEAAAGPSVALAPATLWGGDINGDGVIDILDIVYVGAQFGGQDPRADINDDGSVDILDIVLIASNFGKTS